MDRFEGGPRFEDSKIEIRINEIRDRFKDLRESMLAKGPEHLIGYRDALAVEKMSNLDDRLREIFKETGDILDFSQDLSMRINILHQEKLLSSEEAQEMLDILQNTSKGKDNYATLALLQLIYEMDLYAQVGER